MEISCLVDSHAKTGEGAVWDVRQQVLYWVDIPAFLIHCFDPATGRDRSWRLDEEIGCLAVRDNGELVIATHTGFHFFDQAEGAKTLIADPEADRPDNRFNDGATDARGRFWAGTMKFIGDRQPVSRFYRLDGDLSWAPFFDGIYTANGLAFAPDGKTMYFSDSNPSVRMIWACDYDLDDGVPSRRRVFFDTRSVAGRPDGATVDSDGCYWMAGVGGWQIVRITPRGKIDRIIDVPCEKPSKPMFGGANLDILFLTSIGDGLAAGTERRQPQAGGLFAITGHGAQGIPQARFAG